jgi:hypothetical protein
VANELSHNEYRHLDIVGNGALFEGAGMTIFVEISQEFFILIFSFAGAFVGNTRRLDDS